jgi:hypothetical protein
VSAADANAPLNNPAGCSNTTFLGGASLNVENRFLSADFNHVSLAACYQINKIGALGVGLQSQGSSVFNQKKIAFTYARTISNKISIGLSGNFTRYAASDYGGKMLLNATIGVQWQPMPQLIIASVLSDPFSYRITEDYKTPIGLALGLAYLPSKKVRIMGDVVSSNNSVADLRFGIAYQPIKILSLRMGYNTVSTSYSFGFGVHTKGVQIDLFVKTNPMLKPNVGLSLAYSIQPKTK